MNFWDRLTGWVGDNVSGEVDLGDSGSVQFGSPPVPWGLIAVAVIVVVLVRG